MCGQGISLGLGGWWKPIEGSEGGGRLAGGESGAFGPGELSGSAEGTEGDADQGVGVEVSAGGGPDASRSDPVEAGRPAEGFRERETEGGELDEAVGALGDALEVEEAGASEVLLGLLDLVIGEEALVHGLDLLEDGGDGQVEEVGAGADVDAEGAGFEVGRVGDAAADGVGQAKVVPEGSAEAVGEARAGAEDVVEDGEGVEVGVPAGDAEVSEDEVDLLAGMLDASGEGARGRRGGDLG